jgi:peptide/nickel transport system permease protein
MAVQTAPVPIHLPEQEARPSLWQRITRNYVFRRIVKAILTIWAVITITFFIVRLMPGNPVEIFIEEQMALYNMSYKEAKDQAGAMLSIDLDTPVTQQYVDYMGNLLRGDLGQSYRSRGTPVIAIIRQFLPWTLFSVGTALLISFTLGVGLGMWMAYRRETPVDHTLSTFASLVSSIPNNLVAIILIVVLSTQLKVINYAAMRGSLSPGVQPGFTPQFIGDVLYHAILPVSVYVLTTVGSWMLAMKSSTVATLEEDYVTVARARGLKDSRIMTSYVGRNASLPLFTQLAISIGFVVGGSILIESIFVYQGIGQQLFRAISQRDYSVMQGIFLAIVVSVVVANLLADLLYSRLDPRIRLGGSEVK